jgi:hypothetical protein
VHRQAEAYYCSVPYAENYLSWERVFCWNFEKVSVVWLKLSKPLPNSLLNRGNRTFQAIISSNAASGEFETIFKSSLACELGHTDGTLGWSSRDTALHAYVTISYTDPMFFVFSNFPSYRVFVDLHEKPWHLVRCQARFSYVEYNSRLFNGFNNCSFWSIIVVITLGKCAHRTPAGVRRREFQCIDRISIDDLGPLGPLSTP